MQTQKLNSSNDDTDEIRRSVHDVAAAIISVRALAETLGEHIPMLVAMSRTRYSAKYAQISPETLDALPAIPAEIVELCEIARGALQTLGRGTATTDRIAGPLAHELPRATSGRPGPPAGQTEAKGVTVLLVDDEETVRYVISQTLEEQGCRVTSASDGEEALGLLEETDYDLILLDLRIPGMSGWETAEKIRMRESAQGRHTQIVGLTASPLLEDQQRAIAAGMDNVLVKPIDNLALQSMLRHFT